MNGIRLTQDAVATIAREARASEDGLETGGVLLGFDDGPLGEALVMEAGGPGPNAERRADFFLRDLEHAQQLADEAFARTTARWIGEWHTHPHGLLQPSRKDLRTYRRFLRDADLAFSTFVAVIVGSASGEGGWRSPRATGWLIESRRLLPAVLLPKAGPLHVVVEEPMDEAGGEQ